MAFPIARVHAQAHSQGQKASQTQMQQEANNLGERIERARDAHQWSMGELARRSNIDRTTISRIESGDSTPTTETLTALATALRVSPNDLLGMSSRKSLIAPLPSFSPYMRSKYSELPPEAVDDLERHFQLLAEKHGVTGFGPQPGEDEF